MDPDTLTALLMMLIHVGLFATWVLPIPSLVQSNIWAICEEISDQQAQEDAVVIKSIAVFSAVFWPILVLITLLQMLFMKAAK